MIIYISLLNIIYAISFIYGQKIESNDCVVINKILNNNESFDCCTLTGNISCKEGRITEV